jgi:hypothetical protein
MKKQFFGEIIKNDGKNKHFFTNNTWITMGNQQSSINIPDISLKIGFNTQSRTRKVIFCVGSLEFDNPFDVLNFPFEQRPVGLEIIPHGKMRDVKQFRIKFENGSTSCGWFYMDDANPESFQVLPVGRIGQRLRNSQTKFYFCDRIEGTTEWVITFFQVRDVDGNLEFQCSDVEQATFSAGCRITERSIIDTGSTQFPEFEYIAASNEVRLIEPIHQINLGTIYARINNHLQPPIIQMNAFINESSFNE